MRTHTPGPSGSTTSIGHVTVSSLQWQCGIAAYLMPEGTLKLPVKMVFHWKTKLVFLSSVFSTITRHLVRGVHSTVVLLQPALLIPLSSGVLRAPRRPKVCASTRSGLHTRAHASAPISRSHAESTEGFCVCVCVCGFEFSWHWGMCRLSVL